MNTNLLFSVLKNIYLLAQCIKLSFYLICGKYGKLPMTDMNFLFYGIPKSNRQENQRERLRLHLFVWIIEHIEYIQLEIPHNPIRGIIKKESSLDLIFFQNWIIILIRRNCKYETKVTNDLHCDFCSFFIILHSGI